MSTFHRFLISSVYFFIAVTLASCGVKEYILPSTAHIDLQITASNDLNPNKEGRPSPLVIRMYELHTRDEFANGDFFTIYDNETKTLGKSMLAKDEMEFKPGEKRHIERATNPQTRFLGIVAAYRDIDNARWRALVAIPEKSHSAFNLNLGPLGLSLTPR